jgi:hypothetical protein
MLGHTYEKEKILEHLEQSSISPVEGEGVELSNHIQSNKSLLSMIHQYLYQHPEIYDTQEGKCTSLEFRIVIS